MSLPFTAYCTDEDIAARCAGDYAVLCPKWQVRAAGTDGALAATSGGGGGGSGAAPLRYFAVGLFGPVSSGGGGTLPPGPAVWVLTSATVDFAARGLAPGHVVRLSGPKPTYTGAGELFAVDAVASGGVTLRRLGLPSGEGQPPAPPAGLAGITFDVPTLGPQIDSACLDLNNTYGIDPNRPTRAPGLIYDPNKELTQAAVLTVLQRQYAMEVRSDRGDFALKLRQVEADLGAVKARLSVQWGPLGQAEMPTSTFSMRTRR